MRIYFCQPQAVEQPLDRKLTACCTQNRTLQRSLNGCTVAWRLGLQLILPLEELTGPPFQLSPSAARVECTPMIVPWTLAGTQMSLYATLTLPSPVTLIIVNSVSLHRPAASSQ